MSGWLNFLNIFKTCGKNDEGCYGKKKRPLRTITIFINTHGVEYIDSNHKLSSKIKNSHTLLHPSGKKGLPLFTDELGINPSKFHEYFTIIPYLRRMYKLNEKSPVVFGNKELSKKFKESMYTPLQEFKINSTRRFYYNPNTLTKRQIRLNEYNKTFESSKILKKQKSSSSDSDSDSDKVPTTTTTKLVKIPATEEDRERDKQEEDKHRLVHESENNSLRQLSYDKRYVVLNDNISNFMGIYIIAVNNVLNRTEYDFLNSIESWEGNVAPDKKSNVWNVIEMYQKNNLMIENVYREFYEYCMENSPKKIRGMPDDLSSDIFSKSREPSKYNNVLLSTIVALFLSIGFEHVNIIDATCREIHDDREPETVHFITRQHSDEEVENYEEWEKEASNVGTGNKKPKKYQTIKERHKKRARREKRTRRK